VPLESLGGTVAGLPVVAVGLLSCVTEWDGWSFGVADERNGRVGALRFIGGS
jgi:hypothetical protein